MKLAEVKRKLGRVETAILKAIETGEIPGLALRARLGHGRIDHHPPRLARLRHRGNRHGQRGLVRLLPGAIERTVYLSAA